MSYLYARVIAFFLLACRHHHTQSYFSNTVVHYVFINALHKRIKIVILVMGNYPHVIINFLSQRNFSQTQISVLAGVLTNESDSRSSIDGIRKS